jgi:hypothetical protein
VALCHYSFKPSVPGATIFAGATISENTVLVFLRYNVLFADSFANNPQFVVTLRDFDEDRSATVLVELSQMDRRGGLGENLNIGFVVYQVVSETRRPVGEWVDQWQSC